MKHTDVVKALNKFADKKRAKNSIWYFKTGEGQYGYGDVFIGVTVPKQRKIAKKFYNLQLVEIQKLLKSKIHEHRLTALFILTKQFEVGDEVFQTKIVRLYLRNTKNINNWDLVDQSAPRILGAYLCSKKRNVLYKLVKSKNLWERRIAILSTLYFIVKTHDYSDTLKISKILLLDKHDLIHKAVGWMLREVGKRDEKVLTQFLEKNMRNIPRTTLRYAIEKFPETKRQKFLHGV
jgi:3-methyladenine DNA glycosylase AlkD